MPQGHHLAEKAALPLNCCRSYRGSGPLSSCLGMYGITYAETISSLRSNAIYVADGISRAISIRTRYRYAKGWAKYLAETCPAERIVRPGSTCSGEGDPIRLSGQIMSDISISWGSERSSSPRFHQPGNCGLRYMRAIARVETGGEGNLATTGHRCRDAISRIVKGRLGM